MDAIDGLKYIAAELHAGRVEFEKDMDIMDGHDQAAFHAEQLAWMQEAELVLSEATRRPITVDEAKLLAWCGNLKFNQQEAA